MKTNGLQSTKKIRFLTIPLLLLSGWLPSEVQASESYALVYSSGEPTGREVYLADKEGKSRIKLTGETGNDGYPAVSPDGEQLAFYGKYDDRKTWSIHTVNIDGSNMQRLTHTNKVWDSAPAWSPDGETIAFGREYRNAQEEWQEEVWLMNADGSNQRRVQSIQGRAPYFLQDGRILFHSKIGPSQICIADIDGTNIIKLTDNEANDWSPKVSPDGTKIAFISNRDGNQEVYTMNVDGSNQARITFSDEDDWGPAWSGDGGKLFFNSRDSEGVRYVYKMNSDGSSIERMLKGGSQVTTAKLVPNSSLDKLFGKLQ
ncbi:MAG: hypothetical protein ABJN62_01355 [Halioglobus sp.]